MMDDRSMIGDASMMFYFITAAARATITFRLRPNRLELAKALSFTALQYMQIGSGKTRGKLYRIV
jgi:hypothetical protein